MKKKIIKTKQTKNPTAFFFPASTEMGVELHLSNQGKQWGGYLLQYYLFPFNINFALLCFCTL